MSYAFVGEHDLTKREGFEFTSRVRHFGYTTHNSYNEQKTQGVIEYDIAVLELEKPVDFTDFKHIRYRWVYVGLVCRSKKLITIQSRRI